MSVAIIDYGSGNLRSAEKAFQRAAGKLDSGVGVCGKEGQSVPVGVGQPTLKMDALTVGGVQL